MLSELVMFEELLEILTHAVSKLRLHWPDEQASNTCSKLNNHYLISSRVLLPNLPFFHVLHIVLLHPTI